MIEKRDGLTGRRGREPRFLLPLPRLARLVSVCAVRLDSPDRPTAERLTVIDNRHLQSPCFFSSSTSSTPHTGPQHDIVRIINSLSIRICI